MRTWLIAPLMAATILGSITPSVAQAQQGSPRGGEGRARASGEMRGGSPWGGAGREMRGTTQSAPSMPSRPAPQAGWRSSNDSASGARPQRGDWGGRAQNPSAAQTPPVASSQPAPTARNWSGGNSGANGRADWRQQQGNGWQGNANRDGDWRGRNQTDNRVPTPGRDRPNWSSDRNRPGQNWSNDRNRPGQNWSNGRNDWNRSYGYNGRLSDRDRWNGVNRWDRDWRRDTRYDWQRYRATNRSFYRMPAYAAPYGWNYGYRRFSIGFFLSDMLFAQNYWINDPGYYRLPPAYGSLRWIRYYDDALLVDMRDGNVVDVIYDFFW